MRRRSSGRPTGLPSHPPPSSSGCGKGTLWEGGLEGLGRRSGAGAAC